MILKVIRAVVGAIILFFDRLFTPKSIARSPQDQIAMNMKTQGLILYHFEACPFCVKVRREIKRLGLEIEMRDVRRSKQFKQELLDGGKEFQVPCLRIPQPDHSVQWMYESSDIIEYLNKNFGI